MMKKHRIVPTGMGESGIPICVPSDSLFKDATKTQIWASPVYSHKYTPDSENHKLVCSTDCLEAVW